ncbi:heavy metal translocating P-type ATPase [Zavarzinia compransoris]|uniref:P-type Zn(2+) transporter n=1 Tax=Zavarzinia compransoris TaxID=1264899 RepID=A0A317ECE3_9PROT|nr:heavy metal translocating P-type ATPase [Zavarzinia compransoris]PWR23043.1 cadmium-translocating P-type ATPase [Zavarzinia compransoris]TDP46412.1 Cd2+/Zn2+-exporting ATPase [Zavarzinia compransoris]
MNKTAPRHRLKVEGMDCASCAIKIETALKRLPGVDEVNVNVTGGTVAVTEGAVSPSLADMQAAIRRLGFTVIDNEARHDHQSHDHGHDHDHDHSHDDPADRGKPWWRTAKGRLVLASGALLGLAFAVEMAVPAAGPWAFGLATLIALLPVARRALAAATAGSIFTIEMLMTIAALGALAIDAGEEAAVVVFLFAVGEVLEGYAASRARRSIEALADLTPRTALRLAGSTTEEIPADQVKVGDFLLVRPGDRVPADGIIWEGMSSLDESPVNGESVPRAKQPGDDVFAGTINLDAALKLEVTRGAEDNTIARIIRLVEEAQEAKAPVARFIDRFARIYMPAVVAIALLVALAPPLLAGQDWGTWVYRALSLLLIACPCALVISTPAAIAAGLSTGARQGLLIKGGAVLEALGGLKTVAFDKTGTLTEGRPQVTDVVPLAATRDEVLALAAGLEVGSNHPLARAILAEAGPRALVPADNVAALAGQGLTGTIAGELLFLGSPRAAAERAAFDAGPVAALEEAGKTVAVLTRGEQALGLIALRDEARDDARQGLARLAAMGIEGVMLTGDNRRTATAIGADLGVEVHAELMPADKARIVRDLAAAGKGPVGKVGDGINDAPALAAAAVGIAMGGGTDVALETADAALLHNRVGGVADLIALSRATLANIRVNVALALGSKAIFLVTTVLGLTGMWIAVLADTGATVLVTLNALRLLRFRASS